MTLLGTGSQGQYGNPDAQAASDTQREDADTTNLSFPARESFVTCESLSAKRTGLKAL